MAPHGLSVNHSVPRPMAEAHSHLEIELGLSDAERTSMLYGGTRLDYGFQVNVFWAVIPHQVIAVAPGRHEAWSINIPVAWLFGWQLPQPFVRRLLHGEIIADDDPEHCRYVLTQLRQWQRDLHHGTAGRQTVVLEVRACLQRLARTMAQQRRPSAAYTGDVGTAQRIAAYLLENFRQSITAADIARLVGRHEKSVMRFYKQMTGMTLWQSLTAFRLHQAQRLLLTTDRKVIDVALESGFRTLSHFYTVFKRTCGMTPRQYRLQLRGD